MLLSIILTAIFILSLIYGFINGNTLNMMNSFTSGADDAVKLCVSMSGMMMLWSGIIKIAQDCGIIEHITRMLRPIIKIILPDVKRGSKAEEYISLNITSNMLGLGNAATPTGIKALTEMKKDRISNRSISTFYIINCASVQIIPTSVAAIRQGMGSQSPYDVLIPIWITSIVSLIFGVILIKFFTKKG